MKILERGVGLGVGRRSDVRPVRRVVQARGGRVVDCRELEESRHVVQRGEEEDGQDVESGLDVVPEPEERCADGDVPEEGEDRAELSFNHLGRPAVQAF